MIELTPQQRRFLKAQAHALNPTVMIGDAGLSDAVLAELDRTLTHHELVKVKVHWSDREERERQLVEICDRLQAAPVQHIGKILVLYRPAEKPRLVLP